MRKILSLFVVMMVLAVTGYAQYAEQSPLLGGIRNSNPTEAMWDVKFNYDAQVKTGNLGNAGALYIHPLGQIWTSRWGSGLIHVWNLSGTVVDSFTTSFTGTRNMCFNGTEVVHAIGTGVLQRVNPVTRQTVGTVTLPAGVTARFISYNPDADGGNGGYWVGNWNAGALNYFLVSKTGTQLSVIPNTAITGTYGVAYDNWSVGGPYLWVWSQGAGAGTPQKIIQVSIATGLPTGVEHDVTTDIGLGNAQAIAGGMFITDQMMPGFLILGGMMQGTPDRLFGYEIKTLDAGVLAPFNLTSPAAGVTVTSFPNSATPVTIGWDTSRTGATYKWIFGAPTTATRLLTVPVGTNSLTLTLGQLDATLAALGLQPGQNVVGQWDVWAFRGNMPANDSLKSTNGPRAITFARGVPQLTAFSLVSPPDNTTLVTSAFNNSPVNITWRKSGDGVTYKWKLGTNINTPLLTLPSGGGGYDTTLTLINSGIDGILAGLGIQPGQSVQAQWAVYAYSGNDSLKSTQTYNITLQRQAKGDVIVLYDSSSTNGRISKDSVTAALGAMNVTFDLYNRGTNSGTASISYRGYKRVILLGEGTSIVSPIVKDSIKAYLNAGTTTNKANLIVFGEDVGYMLARSGSTSLDLDFANNYLGINFVLDRPASGAAQGLIGVGINPNIPDSTIGTWPDVLSIFDPTTGQALYGFRYDITALNAIGNKKPNFEVATFGVDVESLRPAVDGPGGSPIMRMLTGAFNYLVIPVELASFQANTNGRSVTLTWSTATETNNEGFTVQRKAADATVYENLGFVRGNGTTSETSNYSFTDSKANVGTYHYRLLQRDLDGTTHYSEPLVVEVTNPNTFVLEQNYPNPFNPSTSIQFSIPVKARVSLKIFDIVGQEVAKLIDGELAAGYHEVVFNAAKISSGVYFYRIEANGVNGQNYNSVKKMILNK